MRDGPRWRAALGWSAAAAAVAFCAAGALLTAQNGTGTAAVVVLLTLFVNAAVGGVVVTRRPHNTTGWILLAIGFVGSLSWVLWDYGYQAVVLRTTWLPLGVGVLWLALWMWIPCVGVLLPALLIRLPDGRRPSRWLPVEAIGAAGSGVLMLAMALTPGPLDAHSTATNPFGVAGVDQVLRAIRWTGYATIAVSFVGAVAALLSRFRHARGDERAQLKWITSSASLSAAAIVYGLARQAFGREVLYDALTPFFVSTATLPLAIGIAIFKYRLYDIDLVINRTLVYGGLTALLAGLYTLMVAVTQRLVVFSGQKSDVVLLLTAFVAATSFTPVKSWLQKAVDVKFAVHDPASSMDAKREQVQLVVNVLDAHRIARRLVEECATIYGARYAALSLHGNSGRDPLYEFGDSAFAVVLTIPLHSRGLEIGVLSLAARRGGTAYTQRDEQALQRYADAVAEAIELGQVAAVSSR